jgi:hypothetical protein
MFLPQAGPAKRKEKAHLSDKSSNASSTENQFIDVESDVTPTNDQDDRLDDLQMLDLQPKLGIPLFCPQSLSGLQLKSLMRTSR